MKTIFMGATVALVAFMLVLVGAVVWNVVTASRTATLGAASPANIQANGAAAAPVQAPVQAPATTPAPSVRLTADQVGQGVLRLVRGAILVRTPELVNYQGVTAYEVVLDRGTVYVDANTGRVLGVSDASGQDGNGSSGTRESQGTNQTFSGGDDD